MTLSISLGDLARKFQLELMGDPTIEVSGIANLRDAHSAQLAFLFSSAYRPMLNETAAAAVVMRKADAAGSDKPALISEEPRMVWALIAELFDPTPVPDRIIHPSALVHPSVAVGKNVTIGANVVIEAGCHIADDVSVGAGCVIGEGVSLGHQTRLFANVTLYHGVHLGDQCIVHSGAVIGADGFGFEFDKATATLKKNLPRSMVYALGHRVEIGAGTTIDRGALNDTLIADGVKLDNQVQGGGTAPRLVRTLRISGCTAIAGSTRIGAYCLIGGAVGIIDNIEYRRPG